MPSWCNPSVYSTSRYAAISLTIDAKYSKVDILVILFHTTLYTSYHPVCSPTDDYLIDTTSSSLDHMPSTTNSSYYSTKLLIKCFTSPTGPPDVLTAKDNVTVVAIIIAMVRALADSTDNV